MKTKSKKIALFLFSVFCLISLSTIVKAEEICTQKVALTWINGSRYVSIPSLGRYRQMVHIYVGGNQAFCIDQGGHLPGSSVMQENGCNTIPIKVKKALNYCGGNCQELNYVYAQIYVWGGGTKAMAEAYCSYNGEDPNGTCPLRAQTIVQPIYNGLVNASSSGDDFICWNPKISGYQRVVSKGIATCKQVCPEDSSNPGLDITEYVKKIGYAQAVAKYCGKLAECPGYDIGITGNLNICRDNNSTTFSSFAEVVNGMSSNHSGSQNGRRQDVNIGSGIYCSLYCIETEATVTLPGGLANAISIGSSITWPTSEKTSSSKFGNLFPLSFRGKKECVIQVAPNLTYGNSCNINPVDDYKKYLEKLQKNVNSNNNLSAINAANRANNYTSGHGGASITRIPNTGVLNYGNEAIRKYDGITTYFGGLERYSPSSGRYFSQYLGRANEGKSKANSNYNSVYNAYKSAHPTFAATHHTGACTMYETDKKTGKRTCINREPDYYTCGYGGSLVNNDRCTMTESYAYAHDGNTKFWKDAIGAWNSYSSIITQKYNAYNTYIDAYKKATALYQEIKTCAEYTFNCGGDNCDFYNFQTSASMSYTDETNGGNKYYGSSHSLSIEKSIDYSCDTCSQQVPMHKTDSLVGNGYSFITSSSANQEYLASKIKQIEGKVMHIDTGEITYKLEDGLYNYLNKDTNEFTMTRPENANYITLGLDKTGKFLYSNLPTSFNNKVNKKYNLVINNIVLGDNGQFNKTTLGFDDYVCHYQVKSDFDECLCPPGTKHSGLDLYQVLLNSNGNLTCADAKKKYCDLGNVPECNTNCVVEKYCPNNSKIKITSCINSGKSKSECINLLCGNGNYTCSSSTKMAGMDMTSCVQTRRAQGYSESAAIRYCNQTICSLGNLFVYRTIDLKNPFPSKDSDSSVSQNNLRYGMFNLNVKGRYPGYNWNGVEVVKTEIIQNRNTSDYNIYKQKPLYHFELTTSTIMDIREYNRKQAQNDDGYNDFTLDCIQDFENDYLGTACLSKFVHNPKYGGDTTSNKSLCGGAGSTTTLANCLYKANN